MAKNKNVLDGDNSNQSPSNDDNLNQNNVSLLADSDSDEESVFLETKTKPKKVKVSKPKKTKKSSLEGYEKVSFMKRIRTLVILLVMGVFTGSGVGVWYYNNLLRSNIDYDTLFAEAQTYETNYDELFSSKLSITSNSDKANWVEIVSNQGKTPADFTAVDNFALAEWNAYQASSFAVIGHGSVFTLGVKQGIYSARKFDGNKYAFESISSGVISVVGADSYEKNSNVVKQFTGKDVKGDTATWSEDKITPLNEYIDAVGNSPAVIHPYIISSKTVKESTDVVFDEESETYSFTLVLDNVLSVIRYARQVKRTGGLGSYPEFSKIVQKVVIDKSWNIVSVDIEEDYSAVAFGMKVSCKGELFCEYTFNGNVEMYI